MTQLFKYKLYQHSVKISQLSKTTCSNILCILRCYSKREKSLGLKQPCMPAVPCADHGPTYEDRALSEAWGTTVHRRRYMPDGAACYGSNWTLSYEGPSALTAQRRETITPGRYFHLDYEVFFVVVAVGFCCCYYESIRNKTTYI